MEIQYVTALLGCWYADRHVLQCAGMCTMWVFGFRFRTLTMRLNRRNPPNWLGEEQDRSSLSFEVTQGILDEDLDLQWLGSPPCSTTSPDRTYPGFILYGHAVAKAA